MQVIDAEAYPNQQSSIPEKLWHKTKTWIIVLTLLGLVSLNILSLWTCPDSTDWSVFQIT